MSTKPILLTNSNIPLVQETFNDVFKIISFNQGELTKQFLIESNAEFLFSRSTEKINKDLIEGTNVQFYASATSGSDHVDIKYLKTKGIHCFIAKGCNANSVAEYVLYSIFNQLRGNIKNKTIGIVGFGNIGSLVAKYCSLIGMDIIINDPPKANENYSFPNYVKSQSIEYLIEKSDIITTHVPLTITGNFKTDNLLNGNLKNFNGKLIIHSSRGGVINEDILLKLNKNIKLVIDVWKNEPYFNSFLANRANIITPHIAGHSRNGKVNATEMIYKEVVKYLNIDEVKIDFGLKSRESLSSDNYARLIEELKNTRDIDGDFEKFREIINVDENKKGTEFKNQRSNYPIRYEIIK
ncbi:NAD(P)-dependent oxidoreductase [Candidatus Kapabacteria bacterium]|nr:NAD(P)-dependent oxidoreductase [Candidatus Kapabacteria bacterium]